MCWTEKDQLSLLPLLIPLAGPVQTDIALQGVLYSLIEKFVQRSTHGLLNHRVPLICPTFEGRRQTCDFICTPYPSKRLYEAVRGPFKSYVKLCGALERAFWTQRREHHAENCICVRLMLVQESLNAPSLQPTSAARYFEPGPRKAFFC